MTLFPLQNTPQVKYMTRGSEQGSPAVKFHEPRHEWGGIEEGLIEALNAWRAAKSEG